MPCCGLRRGDDRLGNTVRQMIEDVETAVSVSVVSLWEIAVKARLGKLRVNHDRLSHVLRGQVSGDWISWTVI